MHSLRPHLKREPRRFDSFDPKIVIRTFDRESEKWRRAPSCESQPVSLALVETVEDLSKFLSI